MRSGGRQVPDYKGPEKSRDPRQRPSHGGCSTFLVTWGVQQGWWQSRRYTACAIARGGGGGAREFRRAHVGHSLWVMNGREIRLRRHGTDVLSVSAVSSRRAMRNVAAAGVISAPSAGRLRHVNRSTRQSSRRAFRTWSTSGKPLFCRSAASIAHGDREKTHGAVGACGAGSLPSACGPGLTDQCPPGSCCTASRS